MKLCLPSFLLALSLVVAFPSVGAAEDGRRLNFLFILGDDINRDQLGTYGGDALTPNLDQLAKDGMRFDNVHVGVAMCAPFRQELYSGRVTWRTGSMLNHSHSVPGTKSIAHCLQPAGYKVGLLGKSHVGPEECYPFDNVGKKGSTNEDFMVSATAYIEAAKSEKAPFCLFIASNDGHYPLTTGDPSQYDAEKIKIPPYWKDTPELRADLVKHLAEITNLDALLGMMRGYLQEAGLEEDTVLVLCSEQGAQFPFAKWTCYDNGLHTGLVAACPGTIPAGTVGEQLMWIADITPTFVEAAGVGTEEGDFDGKSQWANWKGGKEKVHDFAYGAFSNKGIIDNRERVFPIRVVRNERYSLVWSPKSKEDITSNVSLSAALKLITEGKNASIKKVDPAASWVLATKDPKKDPLVWRLHHRDEWELYDLQKDPYELTNLADNPEKAPVLAEMKGELKNWLAKWDDSDPIATETRLTTNKKSGGKKKSKK